MLQWGGRDHVVSGSERTGALQHHSNRGVACKELSIAACARAHGGAGSGYAPDGIWKVSMERVRLATTCIMLDIHCIHKSCAQSTHTLGYASSDLRRQCAILNEYGLHARKNARKSDYVSPVLRCTRRSLETSSPFRSTPTAAPSPFSTAVRVY